MKRRLCVLLATLIALALIAAPASAAVRFGRIQYDGPGDDTGSNPSLNREWFQVRNTGKQAKKLAGWKVKDRTGFTFVFPSGFKLGAGKTVTVHTGRGANTKRDLYWRQDNYVWNNTGDKATLKAAGGTVIDTCRWGDGPGAINC